MSVCAAYICQHDKNKEILSRTFILYDAEIQSYRLFGLVGYEIDGDFPQYSFMCETSGVIFDYLEFLNDANTLYSYEILNLQIPHVNQLTFEYLHQNKSRWIAAYDGQPFSKKRIGQMLRMVKGFRRNVCS